MHKSKGIQKQAVVYVGMQIHMLLLTSEFGLDTHFSEQLWNCKADTFSL